jgi:hypothetical protein
MGISKFSSASLRTFLPLTILLGMVAGLRGADVPAFLEPDASTPEISRIAIASPSWNNARPLMDPAMVAQDWHWTEHRATYRGFVEARALTPEGTIRPNSLIRISPEDGSKILTLLNASDPVEVVTSGDRWVELAFTRVLPVYFQRRGDTPAPSAEAVDEDEIPLVSVTQDGKSLPEDDVPAESTETVEPTPVAPAAVTEVEAPLEAPTRATGFATVPVVEVPMPATSEAEPVEEAGTENGEAETAIVAVETEAPALDVPTEESPRIIIRRGTRRALDPLVRETTQPPVLEDDLFYVDESVRTLDPLDSEPRYALVPEDDLPPIPTPQELAMQFVPPPSLTTTYEGIIMRAPRRALRQGTEFVLVSPTGRVMAFLDMSNATIPNLNDILGTRVAINGSLREVRRGQVTTINVRSVSPRR